MTSLVHISDLHFGTEDLAVVEGLLADIASLAPALVVVSGDLTQRAKKAQFAAARRFLDRIPFPTLVIPGNHDLPLFNVLLRFSRPLGRYKRHVSEIVEPFFSNDTLAVLGLNTARAISWNNGRIAAAQVDELRRRLEPVPAQALKVLVTHHPFLPPFPGDPWRPIVGGAEHALRAGEACGLDLILTGHLHHGFVADVRSYHAEIRRSILVVQAGTATSRRLRNEVNSYNAVHFKAPRMRIEQRAWNGSAFHEARSAEYVESAAGWCPTIDAR